MPYTTRPTDCPPPLRCGPPRDVAGASVQAARGCFGTLASGGPDGHASAYFAARNTTATGPGQANPWAQPLPVAGTFVPRSVGDFVADATGTVTYTGASPATVTAVVSVSWVRQTNQGQQDCALMLYRSGALVPESYQLGQLESDANNAFPRNATSQCVLDLVPGDTIRAYVTNTGGDDSITVYYCNLIVTLT